MATSFTPQPTVENISMARPRIDSGQSPLRVLLCCTGDGDVISLKSQGLNDNTSMYEDDSSPIEEEVESQDVPPTCEISPPSPRSDHRTFTSKDLPMAQYTGRLCHSPPPMISRTVSIDGECKRSLSPPSSITSASSQDTEVRSNGTPCNCPFVESRRTSEVAKVAVLNHYKKYAQIYTFPDGRQIPTVRSWMRETIARNMDLGYNIAVARMKSSLEAARPGGWPMHDGGRPCRGYLGRLQPWMRALVHRTLVEAGNGALAAIDRREGTLNQERPAFHFSIPGIGNPAATHFPCLCKEAHAISIATKTLEATMTKLAPLVSMLANGMQDMDRAALHSRIWHKVNARIQLAMSSAFQEIMEDSDIGQRCAEHEMTHVRRWMTEVITQHCGAAARVERRNLQWKTRDLQINRFQRWLEQLYLEDEEEDKMAKRAPEEEYCSAGSHEPMDVDNGNGCGNEQ